MPGGYAGKYLDVDLTKRKIKDTSFDDETLEMFFGGRGLAAKILWDRIGKKWGEIDSLGPENLFVALTGPMTAIYPGARIMCSGKSPLSNGTVGSTASTEFASEIRMAGYESDMHGIPLGKFNATALCFEPGEMSITVPDMIMGVAVETPILGAVTVIVLGPLPKAYIWLS